jgi:uncharacterized protein YggT (Ycf19 family)
MRLRWGFALWVAGGGLRLFERILPSMPGLCCSYDISLACIYGLNYATAFGCLYDTSMLACMVYL